MQHIYSGKVRDLYADGDDLILVASDRMSIYDVVLPTPIPDKGKILTQLSLWWFGQLADIVPNHVISASDAAGHDEPLTYAETVSLVGEEMAADSNGSRWRSIGGVPRWPRNMACSSRTRSWSSGRAADGSLMLADEVLTPDSSRFWPADSWVPGRPQHSLDKQFLRDWSATLDWDRTPRSPRRQEGATMSTRCLR